jgi:hypothetical protein
MTTLVFFATVLAILILVIKILLKVIGHKNAASSFRLLTIVVLTYTLLWIIFYFKSNDIAIPFGTNVCFDDWCATTTQAERPKNLGERYPHGQFIVLHIVMSNHARGISQKPSEPGVHIIDGKGHWWAYSKEGQQALEKVAGKQISLDARLELHQSLETKIVFDVPKNAKNLKALIEEGPFITRFLLKEDNQVFILQ